VGKESEGEGFSLPGKVDAPTLQRYDVDELYVAPIGAINGVDELMT